MMQSMMMMPSTTTTASTITSSCVDVTIFESDNMRTKEEMYAVISDEIQSLLLIADNNNNNNNTFRFIVDLWGWIVRSKKKDREYRLSRPLQIAMYFPHVLLQNKNNNNKNKNKNSAAAAAAAGDEKEKEYDDDLGVLEAIMVKCHHFPLSEKDMLLTKIPTSPPPPCDYDENNNNNIRPKKKKAAPAPVAAWYTGNLILTITPPDAWELTQELIELTDPTVVPCHVRIQMCNLQFKSFVSDVNRLCEDTTQHVINVFKGSVLTHADLCSLAERIDMVARFSHCRFTDTLADRIWYDLIQSSTGKNMFSIQMPFLVRIVTMGYDVSKT